MDGKLSMQCRLGPAQEVVPPAAGTISKPQVMWPRIHATGLEDRHLDGDQEGIRADCWGIFWDADEFHPTHVFCLRITANAALALTPNDGGSETFRRVGFLLIRHETGFPSPAVEEYYASQPVREIVIE